MLGREKYRKAGYGGLSAFNEEVKITRQRK